MKSEEIQRLLQSLETKSLDDAVVVSSLQSIRKHVMATKSGVHKLVKQGCVPRLLKLLYHHVSREREESNTDQTNSSDSGVSLNLSIISNLLMESEARHQVKRDGVETLGVVLAEFSSEEIQIRCCRALGNLAMNAHLRAIIGQARIVPTIIKLLEVRYVDVEESDAESAASDQETLALGGQTVSREVTKETLAPGSQIVSRGVKQDALKAVFPSSPLVQATCRVLRYLADDSTLRQQLVDNGVVWVLAVLIKSESGDVVACVMRVLCELWEKMNKKVTERMSSEVVRAGVLRKIMDMVNSEGGALSHQAFAVLLPLTQHPHAAAFIGASDGVPFFLHLLVSPQWQSSQKDVISALCQLAKEAVNRVKIREGGGLKVFLTTLRDDALAEVHDRVVSSLLSFLYDDASLDTLLGEGLVDILLTHLQHCGGYRSHTPIDFCQDAEDLLEFSQDFPSSTVQCTDSHRDISADHASLAVHSPGYGNCPHCLSPQNKMHCDNTTSFPIPKVRVREQREDSPAHSDAAKRVTLTDCKSGSDGCDNAEAEASLSAGCEAHEIRDSDVDNDKGAKPEKESSGHVYSMNSPTYRAETSWHMQNYQPGITCKSYLASDGNKRPGPGSWCSDDGSVGSPYSPLSADSYYSPSYPGHFSPAGFSSATSPAHSDTALSPPSSLCESLPATPKYSGPLSPGGVSADHRPSLSPLSGSGTTSPEHSALSTEQRLLFSSSEEDSCDADDSEYFSSSVEPLCNSETVPLESAEIHLSVRKDSMQTVSLLLAAPKSGVSCQGRTGSHFKQESAEPGPPHSPPSTEIQTKHHVAWYTSLSSASDISGSRNKTERKLPQLISTTSEFAQGPKEILKMNKAIWSVSDTGHDMHEAAAASSAAFKVNEPGQLQGHAVQNLTTDSDAGGKPGSSLCGKYTRVKRFLSTESDEDISEGEIGSSHSAKRRKKLKQPGQYAAVTQNNILILFSRLSVRDDLSKHLATSKVVYCLLGHLAHAQDPQDRCVRILSRIMSNPHCLDSLLASCVPAVIVRSLIQDPKLGISPKAICNSNQERRSSLSAAGRTPEQRMTRSRSLSDESGSAACTVNRRFSTSASFSLTSPAETSVSLSSRLETTLEPGHERHTGERRETAGAVTDEGNRCTKRSGADFEKLEGAEGSKAGGFKGRAAMDLPRTGVQLLGDLSSQATCPYGQGLLSHVLHRHSAPRQLVFATSLLFLVPYWIREKGQKFLFSKGTLDKLMSALCTQFHTSQALKEAVVTGVAFLLYHFLPSFRFEPQDLHPLLHKAVSAINSEDSAASRPGVSRSEGEVKTLEVESPLQTDCLYATVEKNLHLRAGKGGCMLGANRDILMKKSPVFCAMLQGNYVESTQSEVTIDDCAPQALLLILHFLHGCSERCPVTSLAQTSKTCAEGLAGRSHLGDLTRAKTVFRDTPPIETGVCDHDRLLHMYLNTISLADRFLLPEFAHYLCCFVSCSLLNEMSAGDVFQFAAFHGLVALAEDSMLVLLLSRRPLAEMASQLIDLAVSEVRSQVASTLTALVKRGMARGR